MRVSKILIRKYKTGDESKINKLFNLTFNKSRSLHEWYWKFKKNPAGSPIIYVALLDKRIICHVAVIPHKVKFKNNVTSYQGVDVMTLDKYRGYGIFSNLSRYILNESKEKKLIIFAFSSGLAYDIENKKLSFNSVCSVHKLFKPIRQIRTKKEYDKNLRILKIDSFDKSVNLLWKKVSKSYKMITVRNQKYLNWRYAEKPAKEYAIFVAKSKSGILGFIVLKYNGKKGFIMDVLTIKDTQVVNNLIQKSLVYLKSKKAESVVCYLMNGYYTKILLRNGFKKIKSDMNLIVKSFSNRVDNKFLHDRKNWFVTLGDTDWE